MTSGGETTKMKVVYPIKLWNFVVDNFLIWNHLVMENYVQISQIWNSNFISDLSDGETIKMKVVDLEKL